MNMANRYGRPAKAAAGVGAHSPVSIGAGLRCSQALRHGARLLAGVSTSAALDARVLLKLTLGRDEAWLIAHGEDALGADHADRYAQLIARRRSGEPVAYITGNREFWSLDLTVTPAVLIPRPETELLVEHALRHIPADADWRIADLGTGSGAVGLAIAAERPRCRVIASDHSPDALEVAKHNARKLAIENVAFVCGCWCRPLGDQRLHMIVSNPPYVADADPHLREGDLPHEPVPALRAGPQGLDALMVIADQARSSLSGSGWLLVEHGFEQQAAVGELLATAGYAGIRCHRDYAGLPRVTECRLPGAASGAT